MKRSPYAWTTLHHHARPWSALQGKSSGRQPPTAPACDRVSPAGRATRSRRPAGRARLCFGALMGRAGHAPPTQRSCSPGTGTPCGPWSTSAALASVRATVRGRRVRACASRTELHRPARSALLPTSPSRAVSFPSCRVVPDLVGDFDGPLLQVRLLGRVGQIELEPATPDFAATVPLKALPRSPLLQRLERLDQP